MSSGAFLPSFIGGLNRGTDIAQQAAGIAVARTRADLERDAFEARKQAEADRAQREAQAETQRLAQQQMLGQMNAQLLIGQGAGPQMQGLGYGPHGPVPLMSPGIVPQNIGNQLSSLTPQMQSGYVGNAMDQLTVRAKVAEQQKQEREAEAVVQWVSNNLGVDTPAGQAVINNWRLKQIGMNPSATAYQDYKAMNEPSSQDLPGVQRRASIQAEALERQLQALDALRNPTLGTFPNTTNINGQIYTGQQLEQMYQDIGRQVADIYGIAATAAGGQAPPPLFPTPNTGTVVARPDAVGQPAAPAADQGSRLENLRRLRQEHLNKKGQTP
jgi:hypothetical protein